VFFEEIHRASDGSGYRRSLQNNIVAFVRSLNKVARAGDETGFHVCEIIWEFTRFVEVLDVAERLLVNRLRGAYDGYGSSIKGLRDEFLEEHSESWIDDARVSA
jgi:hypothetical protein